MPMPDEAARLSSSFLHELESELSSARTRINELGAKLYESGFYGPPETAKSAGEEPASSNVRQRINSELVWLRSTVASLEHQVKQITG